MLPIAMDLTSVPVMLVGNNDRTISRLEILDTINATNLKIFADDPSSKLVEMAGERLIRRLPNKDDVATVSVVLVAGLERRKLIEIATMAKDAAKLINVEDVKEFCNFYFTSQFRRGDLLISVSTRGASPALSQAIRDRIANDFGDEWEGIIEEVRQKRTQWKEEGLSIPELAANTRQLIDDQGWLKSA